MGFFKMKRGMVFLMLIFFGLCVYMGIFFYFNFIEDLEGMFVYFLFFLIVYCFVYVFVWM